MKVNEIDLAGMRTYSGDSNIQLSTGQLNGKYCWIFRSRRFFTTFEFEEGDKEALANVIEEAILGNAGEWGPFEKVMVWGDSRVCLAFYLPIEKYGTSAPHLTLDKAQILLKELKGEDSLVSSVPN